MKDTAELQSLCGAWAETGAGFPEIVRKALDGNIVTGTELATKFEVAVSTAERWAGGVARPYPGVQKGIVAFIAARLS